VDGVIAVNQPLLSWSRTHLGDFAHRAWACAQLACDPAIGTSAPTFRRAGRRIACVAHLRPQKDHPTLIAAM
jgi:hypothetical protein